MAKGFSLAQLMDVTGMGTTMHIATEHGDGWIYSNTVGELFDKLPNEMKMRMVVNVYYHEGRKKSNRCTEMKPGIAVVVVGDESGTI